MMNNSFTINKAVRCILHAVFFLAIALSVSSCHSSKKARKGSDITDPNSPSAVVTQPKPTKTLSPTEKLLLTVDSTNVNYTAKVKVNLKMNTQSVSTTGSLRMRWNDVIQISLVDPLLGIAEVGRMEFSPTDVLIIDRINKQYVKETYESLSSLAKTDLSYAYVQALFWSESQKPNNDDITYSIPLKQPVTLNMKLSNVAHKDSWEAHTTVSSKYKKVSAEQLFKSLTQSN